MYYLLLSLKMIYFPLFPQASQPSMNFNISELVYCLGTLMMAAVLLFWNTNMAAVTSCENALQLFAVKGAIYYAAIATVIFSRVKISCFRGKAHLVFHWWLYNKISSYIKFFLKKNQRDISPFPLLLRKINSTGWGGEEGRFE